ncbi:hypothetical protein F2P81_017389 [Scophthalmus maximus]|uniref:Uncharacterized protein n=1 Tax=Scophthalmus maximus TaxID=52904 RepID=A0A6A4SEJ3_SCOMX|nr:hypothetical protein F2P81_017389 [Scophthalmus maximus]
MSSGLQPSAALSKLAPGLSLCCYVYDEIMCRAERTWWCLELRRFLQPPPRDVSIAVARRQPPDDPRRTLSLCDQCPLIWSPLLSFSAAAHRAPCSRHRRSRQPTNCTLKVAVCGDAATGRAVGVTNTVLGSYGRPSCGRCLRAQRGEKERKTNRCHNSSIMTPEHDPLTVGNGVKSDSLSSVLKLFFMNWFLLHVRSCGHL